MWGYTPFIFVNLFLSTSSSSCLPDAVPETLRKNLIHSTGQSYPVGLWVNGWEAAYATSALVQVLMEEKMGYNVTQNGPGPGTPDAFYALAGCAAPTDVNDRQCGDGPEITYNHVSLEGWTELYTTTWNDIQRDYPATAPLNLGNMGYFGKSSMYLSSEVLSNAYEANGLSLEFYRSYNISWHDPSKFFDKISDVNTSLLKPCGETRLMESQAMQYYAELTGDDDGVVTVNGEVHGRCWEGHFWLPPFCRNNYSKCLLYFTGGAGWSIEMTMQKATWWQMPIAAAVARDWAAFVALPTQVMSTFYWWVPDPTFLRLQPKEIAFPPFDRGAYKRGDLRTATQDQSIDKYVSHDLAVLAPDLQDFVGALVLDLNMVNEIMLDKLDSGEDYHDVACRWLKNHETAWTAWLPDSTKCFPQFGLYLERAKTFVDSRQDPTGLTCRACESGYYSAPLNDDQGLTYICVPCPLGHAQPSGAALACAPCNSGEYQDEEASTSCKRCAISTYQDQKGQVSCLQCPTTTSTVGLGSVSFDDCRCEENSINTASRGSPSCVACGEGLNCPFASDLESLKTGVSDLGPQFVPAIKEGYYSSADAALEVYKCGVIDHCPGGPPGQCAGGREGAPCAECPSGKTWSKQECVGCDAGTTALWWIAVVGAFPVSAATYYFMKPKGSQLTARQTAAVACGMTFSGLQAVAILGMMTVKWAEAFGVASGSLQILVLDVDGISFSCIAGSSTWVRYVLSTLAFPVLCIWLRLCLFASQWLPWEMLRWKKVNMQNVLGNLLQMAFGTMSALALQPLMCYTHPNGLLSLLQHPGVLCGSPDHGAMTVAGLVLLVVFVIGFLVLCSYAAYKIPYWSCRGSRSLVQSFSFLIDRFRLDRYWYGVPLLVRGPALSLCVVFATDHPLAQSALAGLILSLFVLLQTLARPWKAPALNFLDLCFGLFLQQVASGTAIQAGSSSEDVEAFAQTFSVLLMSCMALALFLVGTGLFMAVIQQVRGVETSIFLTLGYGGPMDLAKRVQEVAKKLEEIDHERLQQRFQTLNPYDAHHIHRFVSLMALEVVFTSTQSTDLSSRVASRSFSRLSQAPGNLGPVPALGEVSGEEDDAAVASAGMPEDESKLSEEVG
ncbi:unnamed protein product [Durusdinium trenchii]|uniref:Tyrosine-protein kinase ephrin type A/B receptor-like domain-containing protein n=1 Tax=Durusdinium trenchii TaxID=1381693 RepID=A0ABP0LZT8_9DINO